MSAAVILGSAKKECAVGVVMKWLHFAISVLSSIFIGIFFAYALSGLADGLVEHTVNMKRSVSWAFLVAVGWYLIYLPIVAPVIMWDAYGDVPSWFLRYSSLRYLALELVAILACVALLSVLKADGLIQVPTARIFRIALLSALVLVVSFIVYRLSFWRGRG